ncbi:MAG: SDR family oxidoreductase, partial [Pseudomonadota bacterium]
KLTKQVDSVIHSAASVKQLGSYDEMNKANVITTINLLEFSKTNKLKDFHYISTISLLKNNIKASKLWHNYCTEEHLPNMLATLNNIYLKTKLKAENHVASYRSYGLNTNIYRVGNLAFMQKNMVVQKNVDSVAIVYWIKYFLQHNIYLSSIHKLDISPVDLTAKAIIKLFDKNCSYQSIYHVFNPYPFDLLEYARWKKLPNIKVISDSELAKYVIKDLKKEEHYDSIFKSLLAHGWMGQDGISQFAKNIYLQNKTQATLKKLDFNWQSITNEQFQEYLNQIL